MIRPQTCPVCDKQITPDGGAQSEHFPFCSRRCKEIDLFRWTDGSYAIVEPADPQALDDEYGESPGR